MRLPIFASCLLLLAPFAAAEEAATPRIPDLTVRVLPSSEACAEAELCSLTMHVLNEGRGPYEGPLSIHLDLHAPAVLPASGSDRQPCRREDYGKFRCEIEDMSLAPGGYMVVEPRFLFVATAFESANACASLEWNRQTLVQRDRLLSDVIAASGHGSTELMRGAGLSGEASRSRLLAALIGGWGEGDAIAANDSGCATIGIGSVRQGVQCEAGEARIGGNCTALAQWCPSNRVHMREPDRCACPAAQPHWNGESGSCEAAAPTLACAAPEADPANFCRCPSDRPVFNAGRGSCVAVDKAVAAVQSPPEPVQPEAAVPADEPAEEAEEQVSEPPVKSSKAAVRNDKPVRTVSLEPKRRSSVAKRRIGARTVASRPGRRCRALQVWGPHLRRCVPFPIYFMGRLFAPRDAALKCPAGYRFAAGRCRK